MILESNHISKTYLRKEVVKDVTLRLESGKIYGLLGPNGCGKTTWMKMMAGLTKPSKGEILFQGHPWNYRDKEEIAYMSTEPFFYDFMDVKMVGAYYGDFFTGFDREKFDLLIQKSGLEPDMKVRTLSSGMTAKLKIAATLARKASLYLLDEPLNGVDLKARDEIVDLVLSTVEETNTLVISTHLIEEIESFTDHVIFMKDGCIIQEADTEAMRMEQGRSIADIYREIM